MRTYTVVNCQSNFIQSHGFLSFNPKLHKTFPKNRFFLNLYSMASFYTNNNNHKPQAYKFVMHIRTYVCTCRYCTKHCLMVMYKIRIEKSLYLSSVNVLILWYCTSKIYGWYCTVRGPIFKNNGFFILIEDPLKIH